MRILALFAFLSIIPLAAAQELRVGIVLPMSGSTASQYEAVISGVERNISIQPSPVLRNVTLLSRDDGGSSTIALDQVRSLVEDEGVHVIVCCQDAATAVAVEPLARELGVLVLSLAGAPELTAGGMLYSLQPDLLAGMRAMGLGAARHNGDLSIMAPEGIAGDAAVEAFQAGALEAGMPVMRVVRFESGARPLTPEALLAATSQAEAIVVWAGLEDSREAVRSLRARGWDGPVVLDYQYAADLAESTTLGELEFAIPPALVSGPLPSNSPNQSQLSAWRVASGAVLTGADAGLNSALLYDALQLARAAFEQALVYGGGTEMSPQQLRSAIHDGLVGSGTSNLAAGTYRWSQGSASLAQPVGLIYSTGRGGRFTPLNR